MKKRNKFIVLLMVMLLVLNTSMMALASYSVEYCKEFDGAPIVIIYAEHNGHMCKIKKCISAYGHMEYGCNVGVVVGSCNLVGNFCDAPYNTDRIWCENKSWCSGNHWSNTKYCLTGRHKQYTCGGKVTLLDWGKVVGTEVEVR